MALATNKLTNANVAVFANPALVDITDDPTNEGAEGTNIQAGLTSFGHTVTAFTEFDVDGLKTALAGKDVLVLPEFDDSDPAELLDPAAVLIIREFVANGGTLVVSSTSDLDLLNLILGTSLDDESAGASTKTASTAGTTFDDDPANINDNSATNGILTSTLPTGALSLYQDGPASTVAAFSHGKGQVVFLGYDWFDAAPNFAQDGGWLQVLDSAISKTDGNPSGMIIAGTNGNDAIAAPQTTALDDFVDGGKGKDEITAGDGNDHLFGGKDKDKLFGEGGNDVLSGGKDKDTLTSGLGNDAFLFDTKLKKAGVDKINDFSADDYIVLSQAIFGSVGLGVLDSSAFVVGKEATNDAQHVIYNDDSGKFYYDADGKGGEDEVLFARLSSPLLITADDILVI